jgi:hypothetical protein
MVPELCLQLFQTLISEIAKSHSIFPQKDYQVSAVTCYFLGPVEIFPEGAPWNPRLSNCCKPLKLHTTSPDVQWSLKSPSGEKRKRWMTGLIALSMVTVVGMSKRKWIIASPSSAHCKLSSYFFRLDGALLILLFKVRVVVSQV